MLAIIWLINQLFSLVWWLILASVILSWLIAFNVINIGNPTVRQIARSIDALTAPLLAPIRRFLPSIGGLDLSPIILLVVMEFLRRFVVEMLLRFVA